MNTRCYYSPILLLCVATITILGCAEEKERFGPTAKSVSGSVTFEGKPVTAGRVALINSDRGLSVGASLDDEGNYHFQQPVPLGKYVFCVRPPRGANPRVIPHRVRSELTCRQTVDVGADDNTFSFDLAEIEKAGR